MYASITKLHFYTYSSFPLLNIGLTLETITRPALYGHVIRAAPEEAARLGTAAQSLEELEVEFTRHVCAL